MKSIYLIRSEENGYHKIGTSKNPNKRINYLQTASYSELKLIATYQSCLANQIEKILHRKYSLLKKEGEWFNLSLENELGFRIECQKIEHLLCELKKLGNIFL